MTSDLRIAVAEFVVVERTGRKPNNSTGKTYSEDLYKKINEIIGSQQNDFSVQIWGPSRIGKVDGETRGERFDNAMKIAEDVDADVVVYGRLSEDESMAEILLEIYVRPIGNSEIDELIRYAIPNGFQFRGFPPLESLTAKGRIDELSILSYILAIYVGGDYYSKSMFQKAIEYFEKAENIDEPKYAYILMGNTYIHLAEQENSLEYFHLASESFERALEINPNNPWAINGLAEIKYRLALNNPNGRYVNGVNLESLAQASEGYQRVLEIAPPRPSVSQFQNAGHETIKAYFGQGQISFAQALSTKDLHSAQLSRAKEIFEEIVSVYEKGNSGVKDLACHANAYLGMISEFQDKMNIYIAANYYEKAISLCDFEFYKAYYNAMLGDLYASSGRTRLAMNAYEEAIRYEKNPENKKKYEEKINALIHAPYPQTPRP